MENNLIFVQNIFFEALHLLAFFFTAMSILVIFFGFCNSAMNLIHNKKNLSIDQIIRLGFDRYLLLGLQLLIVADIIDTIIFRDIENILIVLLIVIIRTIMSWEIKRHD